MSEKKYEFRKRLEVVHKPDRRNPDVSAAANETELNDEWRIVIAKDAGALTLNVAKDLQDYLLVSMQVSVPVRRVEDVAQVASSENNVIVLADRTRLPELGESLTEPRSYRIVAEENRIAVCGFDDRGVGQGSYFLEDLMNLKEAPIVSRQDVTRTPLFSPRMVHSGWGLDHYPDSHLNAMAHAGIDSILLFVKDVNETPDGFIDFNYLIDRAELYGLDVYAYSYITSRKHPDAPDAEEYYDGTYGALFKACPRLKGVIFVGESCEFPSHDPNTTGMLRLEWPKDKPQTKVSPGWWPCVDFPQWLNMIKKVIHKHNDKADIVFWTYNWGWAPEEDRLKLIRALPEGITLQVTFEMFEQIKHEHITSVCVDYTVSFEGPGRYFSSEAEVAHERGIKLYTMCNTGGLTWDIGVIPYEPVPFQWAKRHAALLKAREDWGLSGLMESHHFGWWPSFLNDLTKTAYWSAPAPAEDIFAAVAKRDFSAEAVPYVLEAWRHWSEGISHYIPTNEDQYGPFRIGPSYPLIFQRGVQIPASKHAMFGNEIIVADYRPHEGARQSLGASRIDVELRSLERMLELWQLGNESLNQALTLTPEAKLSEGKLMLGLNEFIALTIRTVIHAKQWWKLKQRLFIEGDPLKAAALLDELEAVAKAELANAEAAIPLTEADSRLGWEPSMDYMTDPEHLQWKIAQIRSLLDSELPTYRKSLALTESGQSAQ